MGDHVSVANGQEGDGDHPQGLHVVAAQVSVVVVPSGTNKNHRLMLTLWGKSVFSLVIHAVFNSFASNFTSLVTLAFEQTNKKDTDWCR